MSRIIHDRWYVVIRHATSHPLFLQSLHRSHPHDVSVRPLSMDIHCLIEHSNDRHQTDKVSASLSLPPPSSSTPSAPFPLLPTADMPMPDLDLLVSLHTAPAPSSSVSSSLSSSCAMVFQ